MSVRPKLNYVLVNNLGEEYELGNLWMPQITPLESSEEDSPLYRKDGSYEHGNPAYKARTITLSRTFSEKSDEDYVESLNAVARLTRLAARPIYIEERRRSYRQRIRPVTLGDSARDGAWRHIGKQTLVFRLLDAVWEAIDEIEVESVGWMASGDTLAVNNTGDIRVECAIRVVPQSVLSSFTLLNQANQYGLTISSSAFVPGSEFLIDGTGSQALFRLNESDASPSVQVGSSMIELEPGVNNIRYTSSYGGAALAISFRPRRYEV